MTKYVKNDAKKEEHYSLKPQEQINLVPYFVQQYLHDQTLAENRKQSEKEKNDRNKISK